MKEKIYSPSQLAWKKLLQNKLAILGAVILLLILASAVFAPWIAPYDIRDIDLFNIESGPSAQHLLGTDDLGRDVFSRLVYGGRVSMAVGLLASLSQIILGTLAGAIAGYFGGVIDSFIMRTADVIMCFPFFLVAIAPVSYTHLTLPTKA